MLILAGKGEVGGLLNVLDSDHATQRKAVTDDQHLLDAVLVQLVHDFFARRVLAHRDQSLLGGHHHRHRLGEAGLKAQVAAGDDADQLFAVDHWHAGNLVLARQFQHLANGEVGRHGDRVDDDAGLILLDAPDLAGLRRDRQVLVHDADAAFLRDGDG